MSYTANWNYPTSIRFGNGRVAELPDACRELHMTNPLLITDPELARLPISQKAVKAVTDRGLPCGFFADIRRNPVGLDVERGVEAMQMGGHDGVIAFGGGAALDVGKAVAMMAFQKRPLWDFEDIRDYWKRASKSSMLPCVAVPTTSGTGSEVGRCSVIINQKEQRKVVIFHPKMLPGRVIADPELTVSLPASVTAAVGMDALSHNVEAFCASGFHPMADGIALQGIKLIHENLIEAFRDGSNIVARSNMMAASLMGATAFQKGLGAMHAMSHPIGAYVDAHHGLTNAIVMPYVLDRNRDAIDSRMTELARYLGLEGEGTSPIIQWVLHLREQLEIPHTLQGIAFNSEHCSFLAGKAKNDPTSGSNPVLLSEQGYEELYRKAYNGELKV
jgi:alcohol dehydrogenase class IV